jgi:hypothetical protein
MSQATSADRKAYHREYQRKNRARISAQKRLYTAKNKTAFNKKCRDWHHANPEKVKANALRKYGMTLREFEYWLFSQKGLCAICELPMKRVTVDHSHKSGRVRGLLCSTCNTGIGMLRDNPDVMRKAATYVETLV